MSIRNNLSRAAAAALLALAPLSAAAGPEMPANYFAEDSYEEHVAESAVPYYRPAPAPVPFAPAPRQERVEVHVQISNCPTPAGLFPRPPVPVLPVTRVVGYSPLVAARQGCAIPPPPIALRPAATWIKGRYGPRPLVPGW